jgi:hypothetical protein
MDEFAGQRCRQEVCQPLALARRARRKASRNPAARRFWQSHFTKHCDARSIVLRATHRPLQFINVIEKLDELVAEGSHPVFDPWRHLGETGFVQYAESHQFREPLIEHFAAKAIDRMFHFTWPANALPHKVNDSERPFAADDAFDHLMNAGVIHDFENNLSVCDQQNEPKSTHPTHLWLVAAGTATP